jgi:glutaminyl-peptide cyclotransferase
MKKQFVAIAVFVLAVLVIGALAISLSGLVSFDGTSPTQSPTPTQTPFPTASPTQSPNSTPTLSPTQTPSNSPTLYTYNIIQTYPHDPNAFTEGLVFDNGYLYESTGESSSLRRVDLTSGNELKEVNLPAEYFGEGLTIVNDTLIQLTWQNHIGFIYDKATLSLIGNFSYSTEGWGLTYDGNHLIMSDGTSNLYFLDPTTFQRIGQVSVHDGNTSVTNINELEYVNGDVYANIWMQQKIAIINPQTGQVKGWIDLSYLYQTNNPTNIPDNVLNGIAYDAQTNRLFVTGKDWPNLYQITITPKK